MKVKTLNINEHKHLQNLKLDFTYPEGHENFGQPLKKVCIIGQSATGKTTILEMIRRSIFALQSAELVDKKYLFQKYSLFDGELEILLHDGLIKMSQDSITKNGEKFQSPRGSGGGTLTSFVEEDMKLLYFSAELLSVEIINVLNQTLLRLILLYQKRN